MPAVPPITMPVDVPIWAMDVLLLLQAPPPGLLVKVDPPPMHTCKAPPMAVGAGLMVTVVVTVQPVPMVYDIRAVPADTPVYAPVAGLMVAMPGEPLLQVPPATPLYNGAVAPAQALIKPVMAVGPGLTVTGNVV